MLNKLLDMLRQYHMVERGDTVCCAVSGGADSMALLWAMYLLRDKLEIRLTAVHFNHGLRGEESDADEAFVRTFCQDHGIPLKVGGEQVQPQNGGLEAAARDARYRFFRTVSGKIATAHTADDNAETVLLHLIRGTGLKGLGAIAPVRGNIIRPMLGVTRQEVMEFLEEYHIPHREDSSNGTDQFLRNRIRHHVMPLLKKENPRLAENLSAMARQLREDEVALSVFSRQTDPGNVTELRQMLPAQRNRALEKLLKQWGVREPEAEHIALAEKLVFSDKPSASACFPGNVTVTRNYGRLERQQKSGENRPESLNCPGSVDLPHYGLRLVASPADAETEYAGFPVRTAGIPVLRSRQPGDEMTLSGGTKSLKKLFIDRKIPAAERPGIPVLADERGILWACGFGFNLARRETEKPTVIIYTEKI